MQRFTKSLFLLVCSLVSGLMAGAQVANFTANNVSGCAPLIVQFTSTSTGNITSYSWNLGNSVTSTLQNPSTTYTAPGTYTVTLTVSGPGGSNTKTVTNFITVHPQPTVVFSANSTAGCPPLTVQFTSTSTPNAPGGMTYSWDFGDGYSDNVQNPVHTYTTPGIYSPTLVVTNSAGCSKTLVKANYIEVYTPPNGDFTFSATNFCDAPAVVNFTNITTGFGPFTAAWQFGDGGTAAVNNPPHTYLTQGTYTVTMIVTDAHGCKDTVIKPSQLVIGNTTASFSAQGTACPYDSVLFTNSTPNTTTTNWDFGDGGTSTLYSPYHVFAAGGTYNVRLITNAGGCIDTVIHPITIHPKPVANFTWTPNIPCPAPATVQFTSTGTGAVSWFWDFGDGTPTSTVQNPSHTYSTNSYNIVTLVVTSANGCRDTIQKNLLVHNLYVLINPQPDHGCIPQNIQFSATAWTDTPLSPPVIYPSPIVSYLWNFGDGSPTSTLATPAHVYTVYGSYLVTVTITTANGCTATRTYTINVGTLPVPNFFASPLMQCPNQPIIFTNTSTGGATLYTWHFGDGLMTSTVAPDTVHHSYQTSGTYSVTLIANNNGCMDTMIKTNYVTVLPSSASFLDSIYCPPSKSVKFKNTSVTPTWWQWYFGDGDTSTQMHPVHAYAALGTYTVTLVTYNSGTGCRDTFIKTVTLVNPQLSFMAPDTAVCLHDTIHLSSTYTGIATNYAWRLDGQFLFDTLSSIKYAFHTRGFHTVTLLITSDQGCVDSLRKTNYILMAKPIAAFGATPLLGCIPMNVTFIDSTIYTVGTWPTGRDWTFGDGGLLVNNLPTAQHTYTQSGLYPVKLIVTDNVGCKDTLEKISYIDARDPIADFYVNATGGCLGQVITFNNNSVGAAGLTYNWDFGDNTTSGAVVPTHVYAQTGIYTVRLIVTDNAGCKDTLTKTNYISITKPNASFTLSDTLAVCPPLLVHFTNTSTGATGYAWNFGNGNPSYIANPVNTFTTPGNFNVVMIASDANGCTDTATANVKVLGYAGALTYSPLIGCPPLTVNFTASVINVPNLVWDFSDGVTVQANGATISHTYLSVGAYVPKLIFSDGMGCINSSVGLDTIKVDGVYAGFKVFPPCEKTAVVFTDTSRSLFSPVGIRQWIFDTGPVGSGPTATHLYGAPGSYPVTLIVTNNTGCKDTITRNVQIHPLPIISAIGDTAVCPGDPAPMLAAGGISYTWSPGGTLTCTACHNPSATPTTPTVYFVTGTDINGCSNRDSVHVDTQVKTSSDVSDSTEICIGHSIRLVASGAQNYQWYPAGTLSNTQIADPVAMPTVTTSYMVIATEGNCPPDTNYVRVVVRPLPTVNAGADQSVIAGNSVSLQATGTGVSRYEWMADPTLSCTACSGPFATPERTTTYIVVAFNSYDCSDTDDVVVRVMCDQSQVFIPNTFTPNGDGQNDYFFPRGKGVEKITSFRIYSRWGELLYERTNIDMNDERSGWDGTYKGAVLGPDVYVYALDGVCDNGDPLKWKGDVTIMR